MGKITMWLQNYKNSARLVKPKTLEWNAVLICNLCRSYKSSCKQNTTLVIKLTSFISTKSPRVA
jgi:hypothetical protein